MNLSFSKQIELVLEDGQKSGTHKFALIRAIVDYAIENNIDSSKDLKIPLIHIALNHIDYYWKLFLHDVKQVSGGNLPYYKFIHTLCEEYQVDLTDKIESKLYILKDRILTQDLSRKSLSALNGLRGKIQEMPLKHALVMKEFTLDFYSAPLNKKSLKGSNFEEIYKYEEVFITIPKKHLDELQMYKSLLSKICILHWASMTDGYTQIPNSGIKYLEEAKNERGPLNKFLKIYKEELGIKKCSYCEKEANTIDHVYPWKYAKRDEFWNMLPSCKSCNSKKSDKILPISKENKAVLKKFISHILTNHKERYHDDIKYRSIIDDLPLESILKPKYLLNLTLIRCT